MHKQHLALTVILVILFGAGAGVAVPALELHELQAVSSNSPPYVFRLPLTLQHSSDQSHLPVVMVRRPPDTLWLVKPGLLEFHLHSLTDLELEIRHGGQTLNRLFPATELQAARTRLQARLAWERYQAAQAKSQEPPRLARLLDEAQRAHQAWLPFEPLQARQMLSRIEQAQVDLRASGATPAASAPPSLPARVTPMERRPPEGEIRLLRQEMQRFVGQVRPWPQASAPQSQGPTTRPPVIGLALGGLLVAAIASLFTGVLVQRRVVSCARQRWRLYAVTMARATGALAHWRGLPVLPAADPPLPARLDAGLRKPAGVPPRRLRVLYKTSRRLRLRSVPEMEAMRRQPDPGQSQPDGLGADSAGESSITLLATISSLRHEIANLQRLLPTSTPIDEADTTSRPHSP
jgi:hypothetical protein